MDWHDLPATLRSREYSRKRRDSRYMSWYFAAHTPQLGSPRFQLNARGGCYHGQRRRCLKTLELRQYPLAVFEGPPGESSFVFQKLCDSSRAPRRSCIEQREANRA